MTTIILPNYNHAKYLPESLSAIFSQTLAPMEVIVIDDASQDDSVAVIKKFQKKHPNLQLLQNQTNKGPVYSVNRGLEKAQGKYVAFCSADDKIYPQFLEELMQVLEKNPEVVLCTSDFCTFSIPGKVEHKPLLPNSCQQIFTPDQLPQIIYRSPFWIPTSTSLYRTEEVKQRKGLKENLKWSCDWFLNYQIAFSKPIAYLPKTLSAFRVSDTSYATQTKSRKKQATYLALLEQVSKEDPVFQQRFLESAVLRQQGKSIYLYLLRKKTFLPFLLPLTKRLFKKYFGLLT